MKKKEKFSKIKEEISIQNIEVMSDTNLERELESNKLGILDIKAKVDEDTIFNIEIQIINRYNMIKCRIDKRMSHRQTNLMRHK